MGTKKISELNEATELNDNDLIPIVNNLQTKKITIGKLKRKGHASNSIFFTSDLVNSSIVPMDVGVSVDIETFGGDLLIIATLPIYVSNANGSVRIKMDDSIVSGLFTVTNQQRAILSSGSTIISNVPAGEHSFDLSFSCTQAERTATIQSYNTISLTVVEL